jgi:hypothetical protein
MDGLKGARLGIIRGPMDPKIDPGSEDYKRFRVVTDQAIRMVQLLGPEIVDPFTIPELKERASEARGANVFETEKATDRCLAQHANAPVKSGQVIHVG